ncbi:Uncharacterised protein [Achromobacter xylosoxidans]|nr:Uncharacterised protein [Achromobacter xylosoxidans]
MAGRQPDADLPARHGVHAALPRRRARSAVSPRRATGRFRLGRRPRADAGRPASARGVGAGLSDLDLAGPAGRPQPPGLCLSLVNPVPLPRQSRGGKGAGPPAPPMVCQAQERHRAAARNHLPAGIALGGHGCQQQGGRRGRSLAGAWQRSSRLRLHHRHGDGARCRPRRGRRKAAHGGTCDSGPRLRHHPRNAQCRGCVAVVHPWQRLCQRAPAHRLDAEPGAHDAGVCRVGRPRAQQASGWPAADRHAHRWRDAVPAGGAHRRRGAHDDRRPDRHGQVGLGRHDGHAVPPLSRLACLCL